MDDDLYGGFNEAVHPALDTRNLPNDEGFQEAVLKSSYGRRGVTGKRVTGPSRMGTAGYKRTGNTPQTARGQLPATSAGNRPVTAVRGAGYTSAGRQPGNQGSATFDPLNQGKTLSSFQVTDDSSPQAKVKMLEKKVIQLLEESIHCSHRGEFKLALDKAKDAANKDKTLHKQRERLSTEAPVNPDLSMSVSFNLAYQYSKNEMYPEAINAYNYVIKNRPIANTGRIKINVGNIYFRQGNYSKAIKLYRMSLDQVPNTNKDLRMRIMTNIGLSFVRMNQYTDAVTSFEYIMKEKGDHRTALHLILSHFALEDKENMKKAFKGLLDLESRRKNHHLMLGEESPTIDEDDTTRTFYHDMIRNDRLRRIEQDLRYEQNWSILMAAKLIAPVIGPSLSEGYEWTVEMIRNAGYLEIGNDLEINKAVKHLKKRQFEEAISVLKSFEKKDSRAAATAATNLSFLYLLQNDLSSAAKYADEAIQVDRFNVGALVNRGNAYVRLGDNRKGLDYYREALSTESTCPEALYNYVLVCKKLGNLDEGLDSALRLNSLIKSHPYTLYQIASLHERLNEREDAIDWFTKLHAFVPSDPSLLNHMSDLSEMERDKHQALSYLNESIRYLPSHIPTLERLAAHYIESHVYEKAIKFLEKAASVQPTQVKWLLMIAACHRRSGNLQAAFVSYVKAHRRFPDNFECLKFIIKICHELDMDSEGVEYREKLKKMEKQREVTQRSQLRSSSRSSNRKSANSSSREGSASSNSSGYVTESARLNGHQLRKSTQELDLIRSQEDLTNFEDSLTNSTVDRPMTSYKTRKVVEDDDFDINDIIDH